jgi:hypothetical protein
VPGGCATVEVNIKLDAVVEDTTVPLSVSCSPIVAATSTSPQITIGFSSTVVTVVEQSTADPVIVVEASCINPTIGFTRDGIGIIVVSAILTLGLKITLESVLGSHSGDASV